MLSRLPSAQHITDSDARTIRLAYRVADGRTLEATAPPSGVIAPPGYYYLFVIDKAGVPSVARTFEGRRFVGRDADREPVRQRQPAASGRVDGSDSRPDSSYVNQPPPLPVGGMVIGLFSAGAGLPALRRSFTEEDAS